MNKINPFTPINPEGLTDKRVGVQDGWRLCVEAERENPPKDSVFYIPNVGWGRRVSDPGTPLSVDLTYRTKAPLPEIPFPDDLPELPPAPEGHRWVYRGMGWCHIGDNKGALYGAEIGDYWVTYMPHVFSGESEFHYAEAVPVEKQKVRRFKKSTGDFLDGVTDYIEIRGDQVFAIHKKLAPERNITKNFPVSEVNARVKSGDWAEAPTDDHELHVAMHGCEDEFICDPYAELKEAYRNGKVIQGKVGMGWLDIADEPAWVGGPQWYRIKPSAEVIVTMDDYSALRERCDRFEKELAKANSIIEKMREVLK